MRERKRCLILSPHPDDAELGASLLAARRLSEGWDITVVTFASRGPNDPTAKNEREGIIRQMEVQAFWDEYLGKESVECVFGAFDLEVSRVSALTKFVEDNVAFEEVGEIVAPTRSDSHQDHHPVTAAAFVLGRGTPANLLLYRTVSTIEGWAPNYLIPVNGREAKGKIESLQSAFQTQGERIYLETTFLEKFSTFTPDHIRRGPSIGEAFEAVRLYA